MWKRPLTVKVDLLDFALITHIVPSERVQAHLPPGLELETFVDTNGERKAFVSVGCFRNQNFRWAALSIPRMHFNQCTYRTYIRHQGQPAVYFFRTYLGTLSSFLLERAFTRVARRSRFRINAMRDIHGYDQYHGVIRTLEGTTHLELTARELPRAKHPFSSGEALSQFLTYRPHGLFYSSAGPLSEETVEHRRIYPWSGQLFAGSFPLWEDLGILSHTEAQSPYSVLVEPRVEFTLNPPLPLALTRNTICKAHLEHRRAHAEKTKEESSPKHAARRLVSAPLRTGRRRRGHGRAGDKPRGAA